MSGGRGTNSVDEIIIAGEGQTIEFKKSDILSDPIHLAKEMVALANTQGGRILVGVLDDGRIEGLVPRRPGHLLHLRLRLDEKAAHLGPIDEPHHAQHARDKHADRDDQRRAQGQIHDGDQVADQVVLGPRPVQEEVQGPATVVHEGGAQPEGDPSHQPFTPSRWQRNQPEYSASSGL